MIYDAEEGNIRIALAGDVILNRPVSHYREPGFLKVREILTGADAAIGNLESLYHNWEMAYGSIYTAAYQVGRPEMLEEVKWLGFGGMGVAMNHAFDCGEAGLLATIDNCRARGIPLAGAGRDLGEARSPAYVETPVGRIAVMSAATTFALTNVVHAGPGRHEMPGKPGISMLRHDTVHHVPEAEFDALRRTHAGLQSREPVTEETVTLSGNVYRKGNSFSISTSCGKEDLESIARYVRAAKKTSDFVVFSIHAHENGNDGKWCNAVHRPSVPDFLVEFCHRLIDEGCDVVFGHGPHVLRGIEVYNGKPIFYSLGNFVFNVETLDKVPAPSYTRIGMDQNAIPGEWTEKFAHDSLWAWSKEPACYQTVIPVCEFKGFKLASVTLHAVDLGYGTKTSQRGRPVIASPEVATQIFDWLRDTSARFGTRFSLVDEVTARIDL